MLGIIAGTGFYNWPLLAEQQEKTMETPYGQAVLYLGICRVNGRDLQVAFLPRHHKDHSIPPHLINYRANLFALHKVGVQKLVAINAVGSLLADIPPGEIVLVDDILDFTWGRQHTFYTGGEAGVKHVDMTNCYCKALQTELLAAAQQAGILLHTGGVYVATQGPRFETRAEIQAYVKLGGTVVGMTGMPEVSLACELGMCYASLSVVTNYACGIKEGLEGEAISHIMEGNKQKIERVLAKVAANYTDEKQCRCSIENNLC